MSNIKALYNSIPSKKSFYVWLFLCLLGAFLWVASMWQLEIITIWVSQDITHFEFPFFLERLLGFNNGISVWIGRDIMYGFNAIGYFIIFPISLYKLLKIADATLQRFSITKAA